MDKATHYNISDEPRERAIAGLSMGGLQSIEKKEAIIATVLTRQIPSLASFCVACAKRVCCTGPLHWVY